MTEITDDAALSRIKFFADTKGKAMSYRIAISFAAAAIASCIATEAIAQEPAWAAAGFGGAVAPQVQQAQAPAGFAGAAAPQMQQLEDEKLKAPAGFGSAAAPQMQQSRAPAGFAGAAAPQAGATGGAYYAPASDNGNDTACGRFPYPPCKKVVE